jgi:hypothetical protein
LEGRQPRTLGHARTEEDDVNVERIEPSRLKRPPGGRAEHPVSPRSIDGDLLEFVMAVDAYKKANNLSFLRTSEIYNVMLFLGYRKVASRMGNIVEVTELVGHDPAAQLQSPAPRQNVQHRDAHQALNA